MTHEEIGIILIAAGLFLCAILIKVLRGINSSKQIEKKPCKLHQWTLELKVDPVGRRVYVMRCLVCEKEAENL